MRYSSTHFGGGIDSDIDSGIYRCEYNDNLWVKVSGGLAECFLRTRKLAGNISSLSWGMGSGDRKGVKTNSAPLHPVGRKHFRDRKWLAWYMYSICYK